MQAPLYIFSPSAICVCGGDATSRFGRAGRQILEVDGHSANVGVAHLRGRVDHHFSHRPAGMAAAIAAALQIFDDVVDAPRFQAATRGAIEPRREPALHQAAAEQMVAFVGAEQVLGRVARTAMRHALDQIGAAIPVRAFLLIGLEYPGPEEQIIPDAHQCTVVERPSQVGRWRGIAERRQRRKIGADCEQVVAGKFREIGIGERRIVPRTVGRYALAERATKVLIGPCADPGIAIRRQVRRIDTAERRVDPFAPGEWFGRIGGVATRAIARIG